MRNDLKICSKCNAELPATVEFFNKQKGGKNGLKSKCKKCDVAYRQENKLKLQNYFKDLYQTNKVELNEKRKPYAKQYKQDNVNKIKVRYKTYYEANKSEILIKEQAYYKANKDKIKKRHQGYSEKRNIKRRERIKNDELFKLKENIRGLIRKSFITSGIKKSGKTVQILGCSIPEFKVHLEKQFDSWMSWSNYGMYKPGDNRTWNIDHVIPMKSAKSSEDINNLNHYSNLRPLCSKENREKWDKLI